MSIWQSKSSVPIEQTERAISSVNGLNYSAGQVIDVFIPPTTKFIIGKDCYLTFDVEIALPADTAGQLTRIQLDAETGGQSLCRTVSVWAGNKQTLLEQIVAYNNMVSIKYDYETNDTLKGKRTVEGATQSIASLSGTKGSSVSQLTNSKVNPFYKKVANADTSENFTADVYYQKAKITMPMHTGIFGSEKVFPVMKCNGIMLSIELESNVNVFRMLDTVSSQRRIDANPKFHGVTAAGASMVASGSDTKEFFCDFSNSNYSIENSPFVVGQSFRLQKQDHTNAPVDTAGIIESITFDSTYVKFTTSASVTATAAVDPADNYFFVDTTVFEAATYNPTYTVSRVELVVKEVSMGAEYERDMEQCMKSGGVMEVDIESVTNYQRSALLSDRVSNLQIDPNNSRCRSILSCPTDATRYTTAKAISASGTYVIQNDVADNVLRSCRSGLEGISDHLSEYQWFLNGRLQPSRPINVANISNKVGISSQHLVELEKSLASANIQPLSFEAYNRNFVIGRTLGIQENMVYDARGKSFSLQLNYNETDPPVRNKLWNNFLFHVRRIVINDSSVMVVP
tara:strand:+ start:1603 stop:3312 length:1710 start_codon:yes stop_codon:yes gene_type:complete